jgi:cell division protein ZapA (FtsZ GTPase activity inhibitor)
MNDQPNIDVLVNNVRLRVPVYKDSQTTQAIADRVTESIKAIEHDSDRIDTQRFALEACMQFATELAHESDRSHDAQEELAVQLASVNASLESLLKLLR